MENNDSKNNDRSQTRCHNCNAELAPEDNYCRFCGTKRGELTPVLPRKEFAVLYGPRPNFRNSKKE